jgi:hypothetical protein
MSGKSLSDKASTVLNLVADLAEQRPLVGPLMLGLMLSDIEPGSSCTDAEAEEITKFLDSFSPRGRNKPPPKGANLAKAIRARLSKRTSK